MKYPETITAKKEFARLARLTSKGLCYRCRQPNDRIPKRICTICSAKESELRKLAYNKRKLEGLCFYCSEPVDRPQANSCISCTNRNRQYHKDLKAEVIARYGATCSICGESRLGCLTLDHIDNNGRKHRRELGDDEMTGYKFYRWLRSVKYNCPYRLQVLCANCHLLKVWKDD